MHVLMPERAKPYDQVELLAGQFPGRSVRKMQRPQPAHPGKTRGRMRWIWMPGGQFAVVDLGGNHVNVVPRRVERSS